MCKFLILKYISTYSAYELLQELLMNFNTCSVMLLTIVHVIFLSRNCSLIKFATRHWWQFQHFTVFTASVIFYEFANGNGRQIATTEEKFG